MYNFLSNLLTLDSFKGSFVGITNSRLGNCRPKSRQLQAQSSTQIIHYWNCATRYTRSCPRFCSLFFSRVFEDSPNQVKFLLSATVVVL